MLAHFTIQSGCSVKEEIATKVLPEKTGYSTLDIQKQACSKREDKNSRGRQAEEGIPESSCTLDGYFKKEIYG